MRIAPMEPGHRIQLPADWVTELGLEQGAALEKVAEGILIHSPIRLTWDDVFASKLPVGETMPEISTLEVSDDDLLY